MSDRSWESTGVRLDIPVSIAGVSTVMLVRYAEAMSFVECGDGAAGYLYSLLGRKLEQYERLESVILSHEHLDHCGGLVPLLGLLRVAGRKSDLRIITPEGKKGRLYRIAAPVLEQLPFRVTFADSLGSRLDVSGAMEIQSFATRHRDSFPANKCGDPVPSTGYSVTVGGSRIVFSGDTGPTKALAEKCSGADLAVLESTWEMPVDCDGLHLTVREAMEYGSLSSDYILVHPLRDRDGNQMF